jgi:pSer/pThr/pTyr-binding forkhead associated (FHA) protein
VRIPGSADRKRRLAVLRQIASADGGAAAGFPRRAPLEQEARCFITACGAPVPLRIAITNERTGDSEHVLVERPWALIGADPRCDIHLVHPDVSQRHAYLQVVDSRLLCCDLGSRTGTHVAGAVRARSWVKAGDSIFVGPYSIRLSGNDFAAGGESDMGAVAESNSICDRPAAFLSFVNAFRREGQPKLRRMKRPVTLVGWSETCHLRLQHSTVGRVHCAVVSTTAGLWVVDLLSPGGTCVNGAVIDLARLDEGDELTVGRFQMRVSFTPSTAGRESVDGALASEKQPPVTIPRGGARSRVRPRGAAVADETGESATGPAAPAAGEFAVIHAASEIVPFRPAPLVLPPNQGLSSTVADALQQQFSAMQEWLVGHMQQLLTAMARTINEMQARQLDLIREELLQVQEASRELQELNFELSQRYREGSDADLDMLPPQLGDPMASPGGHLFSDQPLFPPIPAPVAAPGPPVGDPRFEEPPAPIVGSDRDAPGERERSVAESAAAAFGRPRGQLQERIRELEQEQAARWQKILQTMAPADGGETQQPLL